MGGVCANYSNIGVVCFKGCWGYSEEEDRSLEFDCCLVMISIALLVPMRSAPVWINSMAWSWVRIPPATLTLIWSPTASLTSLTSWSVAPRGPMPEQVLKKSALASTINSATFLISSEVR